MQAYQILMAQNFRHAWNHLIVITLPVFYHINPIHNQYIIQYTWNLYYIYNTFQKKTHTHPSKKNTNIISNRKATPITVSIKEKGPLPTVLFWKKHQLFHLPDLSSKNCGKGGITNPWLYKNRWKKLYHVPMVQQKTPGDPPNLPQNRPTWDKAAKDFDFFCFKLFILFFVLKPTSSEHRLEKPSLECQPRVLCWCMLDRPPNPVRVTTRIATCFGRNPYL